MDLWSLKHGLKLVNNRKIFLQLTYKFFVYYFFLGHGIVLKELWNQFTIFQKLIVYLGRFIMWIYTYSVIRALLNQAFMIVARSYYYRATRRQMKINRSNFSINFHDVSWKYFHMIFTNWHSSIFTIIFYCIGHWNNPIREILL